MRKTAIKTAVFVPAALALFLSGNNDGSRSAPAIKPVSAVDAPAEQIMASLGNCRPPSSWRGCASSALWAIHNTHAMHHGWRVFEMMFFKDRDCSVALTPKLVFSPGFGGKKGFMTNGAGNEQGYDPFPKTSPLGGPRGGVSDDSRNTMWVSACGTESASWDGRPVLPPDAAKRSCAQFEDVAPNLGKKMIPGSDFMYTFLGVQFQKPVEVQCVRVLQAGDPYRSPKLTMTSTVGPECWRCAHGMLSLDHAGMGADGWDTYVGSPGLVAEVYANINQMLVAGGETFRRRVWPERKEWEADISYLGTSTPTVKSFLNFTQVIPMVNFETTVKSWGAGFPTEHFMVRFQGLIRIVNPGTYSFSLTCDDEARMYLETSKSRKEVPEETHVLQNNGTEASAVGLYYREEMTSDLVAGAFYMELDFKQVLYRAGFVFEYKGPDTADEWQLVPKEAFLTGITNDREVSNSRYVWHKNAHCFPRRNKWLSTYQSAQAACEKPVKNGQPRCGAIYGRECNQEKNSAGAGVSLLFLCEEDPMDATVPVFLNQSDEGSCIWERLPQAETVVEVVQEVVVVESGALGRFSFSLLLVGMVAGLVGAFAAGV